jgi:hypothetical protein
MHSFAIIVSGLVGTAVVYNYRSVIRSHILRSFPLYVVAAPFAVILIVFGVFAAMSYPGYPALEASVEKRGQYGDSFGIVNSLFTGLGFAGLVVTLLFQQKQINRQAQQLEIERDDLSEAQYDAKLHRLLDLYKDCVSSVVLTSDGKTYQGITALKYSNDKILRLIRVQKASTLPPDVAKRFRKNALTVKDKFTLDTIYLKNAELINGHFQRQGRLIKTFTLLLRHMEDNAPKKCDISLYRMLLQSQLTHIELCYFFLIALAINEENELRRLIASSRIFNSSTGVYQQDIHRHMYLHLWGFDPQPDAVSRKPPFKPLASRKVRRGVLAPVDPINIQ